MKASGIICCLQVRPGMVGIRPPTSRLLGGLSLPLSLQWNSHSYHCDGSQAWPGVCIPSLLCCRLFTSEFKKKKNGGGEWSWTNSHPFVVCGIGRAGGISCIGWRPGCMASPVYCHWDLGDLRWDNMMEKVKRQAGSGSLTKWDCCVP